jgi:asparagine synthase (glutamine-hydrolysing)
VCGIAGEVRWDDGCVDRAKLERICAGLEHRGPDSRGLFLDGPVGLGIQRLRVIDLETGDQPIFSEDRSVVVILNGEIYNFGELRERLERAGHRFATHGDTETIVHLYEEEGPDCVRRLEGMFGLAIWDARRRQLTLARDRLGKKPLFYSLRRGVLTFASELGALLSDPDVPRDLDLGALDAYLACRYIPSPYTAFSAVRKLPPASTLVLRDGSARIERYWRLDYARKHSFANDDEVLEAVRTEVRRAVRRRMVADVPLGAFLSGGVDSATVVAAMAEASDRPVKTFSIGFADSPLDELPLARLVAERFGTDHHELVVEPRALDVLPIVVRHHGEPFADATSIPTIYLARMARGEVTVALNGDGGDEAFGGYTRYVANAQAARVNVLPRPARVALSRLIDRIPPSGRIDSARSRLRRLGASLALSPQDRYIAYMTDLQGFRRHDVYTPAHRALLSGDVVGELLGGAWRDSTATDIVDRMLDVDVQTYLPDDLLAKVDIATMSCSLEGRSPLLDHHLMELAASLPPEWKVRGTQKKVALRAAMRGWVPDEILDAPKRGFQPPLVDWFRGELREYAREVLLDRSSIDRGYFEESGVRRLLDEHAAATHDHNQAIWTLLVFELWHREFVDAGAGRTLAAAAPAP